MRKKAPSKEHEEHCSDSSTGSFTIRARAEICWAQCQRSKCSVVLHHTAGCRAKSCSHSQAPPNARNLPTGQAGGGDPRCTNFRSGFLDSHETHTC